MAASLGDDEIARLRERAQLVGLDADGIAEVVRRAAVQPTRSGA